MELKLSIEWAAFKEMLEAYFQTETIQIVLEEPSSYQLNSMFSQNMHATNKEITFKVSYTSKQLLKFQPTKELFTAFPWCREFSYQNDLSETRCGNTITLKCALYSGSVESFMDEVAKLAHSKWDSEFHKTLEETLTS